MPTDAWNTYLISHFNAKPPPKPPDALNRNLRHIDARASAVPLDRGRISQGMNRTADAFDCPSLAVMTCLVSKFLREMIAYSSPGFEEFSAPFFKYAYPGDEKDNNAIAPYVASFFHVALSEKRIPAYWEKAKISPLYKKGSKLDPNNYRMLAVSGTLYGLYTSILRELVTKWCVENRLTRNLASIQTVARSSLCLF
jgi:hypothetical protein